MTKRECPALYVKPTAMPLNNSLVLTIDIGGSHIKGELLDRSGRPVSDYELLETPVPPSPENVLSSIQELADRFESFELVSVGFPGYLRNGVIRTAPNLGTDQWAGVDFQQILSDHFRKPVLVVNDADLLGLGIASGKGLELVATLGTGFGTALLLNGKLLPHFEIAHHPIHHGLDYDAYIGEEARKLLTNKVWNERMRFVVDVLQRVFNYDTLYLAGGNARLLNLHLPDNVRISDNLAGIKGGARLWRERGCLIPCPEATPGFAGSRRMLEKVT